MRFKIFEIIAHQYLMLLFLFPTNESLLIKLLVIVDDRCRCCNAKLVWGRKSGRVVEEEDHNDCMENLVLVVIID